MRVVFLWVVLGCTPVARNVEVPADPGPTIDASTIVVTDASVMEASVTNPVVVDASPSLPADAGAVVLSNKSDDPAVDMLAALSATHCQVDADCIITNDSGCCSVCKSSPHVMTKKGYDDQQRICAVIDCSGGWKGKCDPVEDAAHFRAVCVANVCSFKRVAGKQ
jgi:hypothetical protein